MTKEKYFVRKVMGNTPVEEKKKIYMQLLKEVNEIETLDTIKEEIYARKKELENRQLTFPIKWVYNQRIKVNTADA